MPEGFFEWFDNPIFIKHVRSRLRPQPLGASVVVVLVFCLFIVWGGYQLQSFQSGLAYDWLVLLQTLILVVMGAGQVSAAVSGARSSGILDFHRACPLSPTELTLGFLFGAPIREYLLLAVTLPFAALFLAFGVPTWRGFVEIMILLLATACTIHALSMLSALILKAQPGGRSAWAAMIILGLFGYSFLAGGWFRASRIMISEDARLTFFGVSLPWLPVVLLYELPLLFFIGLAARRKIAWERIHPLSKPQAVAALSLLGLLVLGGIWGQAEPEIPIVIALYAMVGVALVLTMMVTPGRAEYQKGLWRARKQGRGTIPVLDDFALNRVYLAIAGGIVLVATTALWHGAGTWAGASQTSALGVYPLGIATGVMIVASFGMALQFFLLQFGARGKMYFALFLFATWIVPIVAGTIVSMGGMDRAWQGEAVYCLSPVVGLGVCASGAGAARGPQGLMQGAALTPVLLFAFLFNSLVTQVRRQVHRAFTTAVGTERPAAPPAEPAADAPEQSA
jgi:hypothetical protein